MFKTFDETAKLVETGRLLHISGAEGLLRRLPRGNWIGGSTEYFMEPRGGKTTGEMLDVLELDYPEYKLASYDAGSVGNVTKDAAANGFSVLILPFDSAVHIEYAKNAAGYQDIFLKNITGWVAGLNLGKEGQTPVAVNGQTGEVFADKAVALHIELPADKTVLLNIVNIFEPDTGSPTIAFEEEGFAVKRCLVNGQSTELAAYIVEKNIDTKLPLVGDYSGVGINTSIKSIEGGTVNFYAPVFAGIEYHFAKPIPDYAQAFAAKIGEIQDTGAVFSCNCILNYLYGELEGKDLGAFYGPITFGEVAYQLVNQTLVYLQVI